MTDDEPQWLREQLDEINVMLRTLLTLASLDSDIRLAAAPAASPAAAPSEANSADVADDEEEAAA